MGLVGKLLGILCQATASTVECKSHGWELTRESKATALVGMCVGCVQGWASQARL